MYQIFTSIRSNNLSFIYKSFTPSRVADKGIRIFEFVAKTQTFYRRPTLSYALNVIIVVSKCGIIIKMATIN